MAVAEDLGITLTLDIHSRVPIAENVKVIESLGGPRKWGRSLVVHTHVKGSLRAGD